MKHSKRELRRIRMITKGKPLNKYRSLFDGNVKERNKNANINKLFIYICIRELHRDNLP